MTGKVFDTSFNLRRIIDVYSSFIWNEYYIGYGDFQLRFPMDASALDYIKEGWYIMIDESDKMMIIEKIGIETHVQEGNYAVVEGRSLESILLRRFIRSDVILTGDFQTSILRLLQSNTLTPDENNRRIDRLSFKKSEDPRILALTVESEYTAGDNLYDAVIGLCDYELVGFKVTPNFDDTSFEMSLYMGTDRSYDQNERPWVVFSSKYENLKSSNMSLDTRELKNAAIVESKYTLDKVVTKPDGTEETVKEERTLTVDIHPEITGLNRREIYMSSTIKPEEVHKYKFGKKEDRVNIRDYQEYMLIYFDSKGYRDACNKVDAMYSARIDSPKTEKVWVKVERNLWGSYLAVIDKNGLHYEDYKPKKATGAELIAAYNARATVDTEKPDWLKTPADDGFKLVERKESNESWRKRNARTFSAWGKSYPDKREFEVWGWDFASAAKRTEYENALKKAQEEIDAEYEAALGAEEQKAREKMQTLGLIELSEYTTVTSFDGEVDPNVQFIYGRDYQMGDVVQIVNEFDFQAKTRVVGMLFSNEEGEGFKAIPSFESDDPSEVEL